MAAAILLLAYVQAATGLIPLKRDPLARLLGVGMRETAQTVGTLMRETGAKAIFTSDYETTAWLRFYQPALPVVAVDQPNRYLEAPIVRFESGPLLYFADQAHMFDVAFMGSFDRLKPLPDISRGPTLYWVYLVDRPKTVIQGRTP